MDIVKNKAGGRVLRLTPTTQHTVYVTFTRRWYVRGISSHEQGAWLVQRCSLGVMHFQVNRRGEAAARRLRREQQNIMRMVEQPFVLLRPAFAPTAPKDITGAGIGDR